MNQLLRNSVFALFVATFIIGAPLTVLYTAGYRYNPVNGQIVRTGVLAVSSVPDGALISLSGVPTGKKTPYVFNRVMPGEYTIALEREGYHLWQHNITVATGRTTYASNVVLYLNEMLTLQSTLTGTNATVANDGQHIATIVRDNGGATVWRYTVLEPSPVMITQYPAKDDDQLSLSWSADSNYLTLTNFDQGTAVTFDREGVAQPAETTDVRSVSPVQLITNTQAVEVRDIRQSDMSLVALLPLADYRIAEVHDTYAVIIGNNNMIYLLDVAAANPILLSASGTMYDLDTEGRRFAWSDGNELNTYIIATGTSTFITRQSKPIVSVQWQDTSNTLIVSSDDNVSAFSLNDDKTITPLVDRAQISKVWLNDNGTVGYIYGILNEQPGVYTLRLVR